jgi:carboxymethylenebutenolidase
MDTRTLLIDIAVDAEPMAAVLVEPASRGPWPGVALAFEAFGLTDYTREVATELAAEGYVVVVPDLYHRLGRLVTAPYREYDVEASQRLDKPLASRDLMRSLSNDTVLADMRAALDALRARPQCDGERLGVLGLWNGGKIAFRVACTQPDVRAAVSFYGQVLPDAVDVLPGLRAPVLLLWGMEGQPLTSAGVHDLEERLGELGVAFDSRIYDGAPRGFHNPNTPSYRADAARDAWARALAWFDHYLKEPANTDAGQTT